MKTLKTLNAQNMLSWAMKENIEDIFKKLKTGISGLNEESVIPMREIFGKNKLSEQKKESLIKKFILSFINPFTVILFVLAGVSFFTEVVLANPGEQDFTGVIIISTMVITSGLLRFIQESRSDSAVEKLNELIETTALITRGDISKEIPVDEIVVGDLITLKAGDIIPADIRLFQAKDLFISQSSLTGESEPVEKFIFDSSESQSPLESKNLIFMGSNVVSGSAKGIVVTVGDGTILGNLAKDLNHKKGVTSFEKGVNSVSKLLVTFMLFMVPFIFLINGVVKGDWFEAFLFALSIAVGLTPEMLPMIVSANLAKGARKMAKQKVIVKNLNAIQDLGAMDILCTDKTGTLTQDEIVLERYLNTFGKEDKNVLKYAFLNSFYQTGLKNLIDVAIINHANEKDIKVLIENCKKIDEIPFDFNRRKMSVLIENEKEIELVTKGAVEEMINISSFIQQGNDIVPLTEDIESEIIEEVKKFNNQGLRIIGVSKKMMNKKECSLSDENDMIFIGYLAFLDPPKPSTKEAIKSLLNHNVNVKILTGDNDAVTSYICSKVGLENNGILLGSQLVGLSTTELKKAVENNSIFAKLSPSQKTLIVKTLKENGHTVGFMGDGINDASAMKEADVGISVDTAVDIAKESADIILLEKSLMVLEDGIIEGRKIYGNIIKYIKMTASSNFGNMFSMLVASAFLPFLPMFPIQILMLNLIYDISCVAIPWDNVDEEFIKSPKKWDASSIKNFMLWIGPSSSIFDITTYAIMYFIIGPYILKGNFHALDALGQERFISIFNTAWFIESLWSQTLVIYLIRTSKVSFLKHRPSWQVMLLTTLGIGIGTVIPFTFLGDKLGMTTLPYYYFIFLFITIVSYISLVSVLKIKFIKRYKELL
ncbi:magnesium-translocating P-type ATPase [Cetobacterium somerae]|uniref:magnesium-translocating P-type ATPase n=1 Tax=Cetobacterium sp. NK01 TaxID=2993530 RepID=UPI0021160F31|nr:magnesium-translocating P-type ATPase [Cetobacterium sp. NK01]MCQ8212133.1 magnesium-translocating P-type ATPase [Cetobacterium sp. NK01]